MRVIPSYVASARPKQLLGPAFQEWYSNGFQSGRGAVLTEGAVRDAVAVLLEPSTGIERGGVFSPDLRHAGHDPVVPRNQVAPVLP